MGTEQGSRWYLSLLKPNSNNESLTLNDLYVLYSNGPAFNDLLDDLSTPFASDDIDLIAGPEAMGFALGGGIAARLKVGFLPIRKAGKLLPPVDTEEYPHYQGGVFSLELPVGSIKPGTRVLAVDQWIETGGSMQATVNLVARQGGIVVGIATLCIEAVLPGTLLQRQCSAHSFDVDDVDDA
jgi:adenine phosphoribosyltransferase